DGRGKVDFREMLLGYPNADYSSALYHDGQWKDLVRDASITCLAWIEQHVAEFEEFLDDEGGKFNDLVSEGNGREWLAPRIMARWRTGSPVATSPDVSLDPSRLSNDFDYGSDPAGARCPFSAHIRVANARSDTLSFPNQIRFPNGPPRFIRRGCSYGKPF